MSSKVFAVAGALLLSIYASPASAQTIPGSVRALKAKGVQPPFHFEIARMLRDFDLEGMIAESDLIVTGTLSLKDTHLDPTQTAVLTDFVILPSRVVKDRHPAERPTLGRGLTLTVYGGTMVIEDAQVIFEDTDMDQLPVGQPLVLLLKRTGDGTLRIVGDVQGAFDISAGHVKHLLKHSQEAEEYRKMTPEALVARLAAAK
jgi:hypothetical protein